MLWGEFNEMNASARREDLRACLGYALFGPTGRPVWPAHLTSHRASTHRSSTLGWMLLTGLAWLLRMRDEGTLPLRTRMHDEDEGRPLTPERPPSHRSHPPHRGGAAGRGSSGRGSGEGRAPQWAPREGEAKNTIESTHAAIEVMSIGAHPKSRTRACGGGGNPISRGVAEASAGAASCAAYVG